MRLILALATLSVAGCVDVNDTPVSTRPSTVTESDRTHVAASVFHDLKDPDSARSRDLRAYDLSNGQGRVICGEMNGKNTFGAYVGYQTFYLRIRNGTVVSKIVGNGDELDPNLRRAREGCANAASGNMMIGG